MRYFDRWRVLAPLALLTSLGMASAAGALDFDALAHGEIANGTLGGVTISADNFAQCFDWAVGFDTRKSHTRDPDLQAPFSGGNIADEELNVILILQENDVGCGDGICDRPDDEGARNGGLGAGNLIFDFDVPLIAFGFDVVDVDDAMAENGRVGFFVDDDDVAEATVSFMDFVTMGSAVFDPTIAYGDHSANRVSPITADLLGIGAFDRVIITMGGSGGIDNLAITPLPEPSTAWLVGLGLAGLLVAGERRHR